MSYATTLPQDRVRYDAAFAQPYTICGWFRCTDASPSFDTAISVNADATASNNAGVWANGSNWETFVDDSADSTIVTMTQNAWAFVALACDGNGTNNFHAYVIPLGGSTSTVTFSGGNLGTVDVDLCAKASFGDDFTGQTTGVRVFARALSQAQIEAEANSMRWPVNPDAWAIWPLEDVNTSLWDYSGNERPLTAAEDQSGASYSTEEPAGIGLGLWGDYEDVPAAVAAATNFTLTADPGTFALTGTAANLEYGRLIGADPGTYALTGTAANLEYGRLVGAEPGTYALTGTAANLEFGRAVVAEPGTYALTGSDATLLMFRVIVADATSYAWTGQDAGLSSGITLGADPGSYSWTGQDATLLFNRNLVAEAGAYTLTGQEATLTYTATGYTLDAEGTSYSWAGSAAALAGPGGSIPRPGAGRRMAQAGLMRRPAR